MIGFNNYADIPTGVNYKPGIDALETVRISDALGGRWDITARVCLEHHDDMESTYEGFVGIISATSNLDGKTYTGRIAARLNGALEAELENDLHDTFIYEVL